MEEISLTHIDYDFELFFKILPWRDGTLVTLDGRAQFSTLEFYDLLGKERLRYKRLAAYPGQQVTQWFRAYPESGFILVDANLLFHVYNVDTKIENSFIPVLSWVAGITEVFPLSKDELLFQFYVWNNKPENMLYFLYNHQTKIIDTSSYYKDSVPTDENCTDLRLMIQLEPSGMLFFASSGSRETQFYHFYDWRARKVIENKLTKKITEVFSMGSFNAQGISFKKRFLIGDSKLLKTMVLMTWNEEYEEVKVSPINFLPTGIEYFVTDFELSPDGIWGTYVIGGYRGLYNEFLFKRAFIFFSVEYVLFPVILNNYLDSEYRHHGFMRHPKYGMCFITDHTNKKKHYVRLYKMSDIETEINRIREKKTLGVLQHN